MVKVNMVLTSMGLVIMLTSAASLPLDGGEFESDRADRAEECGALADQFKAQGSLDDKATSNLIACCEEVFAGEAAPDPRAAVVCDAVRSAQCIGLAKQYEATKSLDDQSTATLSACCNEVMLWGTDEAKADTEAAAVCDDFRGAQCGAVANQYYAKMPMDAKATATLSACCNEVWEWGTAEAKADEAGAYVCDAVRKDECVAVANQFVAKKPMDDKATATLKACCNEISGRGDPEEIASAAVVCGAI